MCRRPGQELYKNGEGKDNNGSPLRGRKTKTARKTLAITAYGRGSLCRRGVV